MVYKFAPSSAHEALVPSGQFADAAHVFYHTKFRRLLSLPASANHTMLPEPHFFRSPPVHSTQMWEGNHCILLHTVFAQDRNAFRDMDFALLDLAESEERSEESYSQMWNGYPRSVGEFCVWHTTNYPNLCDKFFSLDGNNHPGGDFGTSSISSGE